VTKRNGEMAKWRNGEMAKSRNREIAKWRNGEIKKLKNRNMFPFVSNPRQLMFTTHHSLFTIHLLPAPPLFKQAKEGLDIILVGPDTGCIHAAAD
jgi:hypothetical protein